MPAGMFYIRAFVYREKPRGYLWKVTHDRALSYRRQVPKLPGHLTPHAIGFDGIWKVDQDGSATHGPRYFVDLYPDQYRGI